MQKRYKESFNVSDTISLLEYTTRKGGIKLSKLDTWRNRMGKCGLDSSGSG